jgi:hypothetical protein
LLLYISFLFLFSQSKNKIHSRPARSYTSAANQSIRLAGSCIGLYGRRKLILWDTNDLL